MQQNASYEQDILLKDCRYLFEEVSNFPFVLKDLKKGEKTFVGLCSEPSEESPLCARLR